MLRPSDIEQLKGKNSRYAMVVGVAQRAREIADGWKESGEIAVEKPVSVAIEDFKSGSYKIYTKRHDDDQADEA
ncbi:MAG: DNA-directed RNA polymerase subunit omega [Clostridia bacterium]|nr:DNA-directed RNA polymerase subunit omega [Clostridia bacterium]